VISGLVFAAVNVFCVSFKATNIQVTGSRAGTLSIVNMMPLFAGLDLNFLAYIFGIRLSHARLIHRSAGVMSTLLLVFHILIVFASRSNFSIHIMQNLWGVIVSPLSLAFGLQY
jgi:hypothetical protein